MNYSFGIDIFTKRTNSLLAVIFGLLVFLAFIFGLTGVNSIANETTYAYKCPDNSHEWTDQCQGKQLAEFVFLFLLIF